MVYVSGAFAACPDLLDGFRSEDAEIISAGDEELIYSDGFTIPMPLQSQEIHLGPGFRELVAVMAEAEARGKKKDIFYNAFRDREIEIAKEFGERPVYPEGDRRPNIPTKLQHRMGEIRELAAQGHSAVTVAKKLQLPHWAVWRAMKVPAQRKEGNNGKNSPRPLEL